MAQGKPLFRNRLLKTIFGMAAGVVVAALPMASANAAETAGPTANPIVSQLHAVAAPTNPAAYRHPNATNSDEDVGVLLVLALDASGSMSSEEWDIQRRATAAALMSTQVRSTIRCKSGHRSIAISVVDFSTQAEMRIPWYDLRANSCSEPDPEFDRRVDMLAAEIARLERSSNGSTHLGNMFQYTLQVFANAPWKPLERRVLDVSGDGSNNGGVPMEPGRQALMDFGVTINGIAIVNDEPTLDEYFRREVVSTETRLASDRRTMSTPGHVWIVGRSMRGSGNNAMTLYTFAQDVENALKSKISQEVAGVYDQDELNRTVRLATEAEQRGSNVVPFVRAASAPTPAPQKDGENEVVHVWRGAAVRVAALTPR